MAQVHFVEIGSSRIAYYVFGQGKLPVFCLHGFSLSGDTYGALGKLCPKDKVMFALDFPLHGQTDWKEPHLTVNDLLKIFQYIVAKELEIRLTDFELMGHSMGGRIALYIYQCFASQISKLILMAPDGLKPLMGHRILFKTKLGPKVFKRINRSSKKIMSLASVARKMRIINRSVYNLVKSSYEDESTANLVYERLMITQDFYPDITTIKKKIIQYRTPVCLFFGKYDSIVPAALSESLKKGVEQYVHVVILESGHLILANEDAVKEIAVSMGS
ncbi:MULTISPECIES: alpha/beta fold hydrolase [Chitinophagaceae]